jgi:hypothetical protein
VPRLTLQEARSLACRLLDHGAERVAIGSTRGHRISGDLLAASCREETLLTFDLRPIERAKKRRCHEVNERARAETYSRGRQSTS